MSREVELKNIQLTATTPVNVQLSLGDNMFNAMTSNGAKLTSGTAVTGAIVAAPTNDDASKDWADSVAFYDYYEVPVIVPASSNNGTTIFTTDDMTGVGRTITNGSGSSVAGSPAAMVLSNGFAVSTPASGTTPAFNENNYIDFPVWFRTSSDTDMSLSVKAVVYEGDNDEAKDPSGTGTDLSLYRAARVAVLNSTDGSTWTSSGVIIPFANDGSSETAQDTSKYYSGKALNAVGDISSDGTEADRTGSYAVPSVINQTSGTVGAYTGDPIIILQGKKSSTSVYNGNSAYSSQVYGDATCVIIRVWLEGEDKDCWNATEGQDFKINLTFTDLAS